MTLHRLAIAGAVAVELLLIAGILMGHRLYLDDAIGVHRTLRAICTALWAFLVPAWFTFEASFFAPPNTDVAASQAFVRGQRAGQALTTIIGGAIAIIIGTTAPTSAPSDPAAAIPASRALHQS